MGVLIMPTRYRTWAAAKKVKRARELALLQEALAPVLDHLAVIIEELKRIRGV
jgi:hypothetical protein